MKQRQLGIHLFLLSLLIGCFIYIQGVHAMELKSAAFENEGDIPSSYTCDGHNISPPISWSKVPEGTASFVLVMDDPDAPAGIWDHWLLFNLPPETVGLAEGIKKLPKGTKVGANSYKRNRYDGPCPPSGEHHYYFKLYALDKMLDLQDGASKEAIFKALEGHILAQRELIGRYQRKK